PCLKEDKTASEERLGRAKAKPPHTHFPEATLSRGSPDCRMPFPPGGLRAGSLPHAPETLERLAFYEEPC
ncbi:hypothetical protein, partial [Shinella sp.]|uniref:hypothetical protein n=1 Tax=Shinella sp. TaxID=1870904 RepID=UPI0028ACCC4E